MSTPEEIHERLIKLGEEWADLDGAANLLEESKRSVKAKIALNYLPAAKSLGKAELMAEANQDYIEHITMMVDNRKKANIAYVNYKAAQVWIDMYRTQESTRRAEMKLM